MLYALDRRGAAVLEVPLRKRSGDRYVAHQLMIGNVRLALTLACRELDIESSWRRFHEALPVRPDGFFGLRFPGRPEGQNRAWFMLEADRSTMPRDRFIDKLVAYQAWYEAGGHTTRLGIKNFRVLTVTRSVERLKSLLSAASGARLQPSLHRLWFTCETLFETPAASSSILGAIWETPDSPGIHRSVLP